ncbi:hypothetical protein N7457_005069 [Penicillium paradoxum]|uniref:uncharacterized protein n=1 Tax=Penicillium paradoxum TaxID=176176 RepID=UPI002546D9F5|nr:uncharacterized protein N7457_005069 [Penicillium paradoxum]KAJ5779909.1 hypothetical protein N7457_005069 [Penicillium paradoxum]
MAADRPKSGFLGNITKAQEAKLQSLWSVLLKTGENSWINGPVSGCVEEHASPPPPQIRLSLLGRTQSNLEELGTGVQDLNVIKKALAQIAPAELRTGILDTLKHDHPDAVLLRFLRARKWDVPKAFSMLMNTVVWRVKEIHVDDDIMAKGELHALNQTQDISSTSEQKAGNDFMSQMRMGKSYVHGVDRSGRPIVVVRVRLHQPGTQSQESLERYIVHVIESVRLTLAPPVETAAVLFDMTGFGLSNMDYPPVKFILRCFEANYPESLGIILIHNSPWVFSGIWRLIRGWMDPEIAAKVQFTNSVADLEKFIARDQIVEELGGNENWRYQYAEPSPNENSKMNDTTTRDALKAERQTIGDEFLTATSGWIDASRSKDPSKIQSSEGERAYLAERLRVNHWRLDPYTRARTQLDRTKVIQEGGKIDFHPKDISVGSQNEKIKTSQHMEHLERVNGTETRTAS